MNIWGTRKRGEKGVFEVWAAVNPADSAKCVGGLPFGANRDEAVHQFVIAATPWAPEFATQSFLSIKDEPSGYQTLDVRVPTWMRMELTSATNWLAQTKLPENLKARWIEFAISE